MNSPLSSHEFLEQLASQVEPDTEATRAPARLKSQIYSALIRRQQEAGPLAHLADTKAAGHGLCVFEELVRISPVGAKAKSFNCCSVCHARLMAETLEHAPIYWGHCPYVRFQGR